MKEISREEKLKRIKEFEENTDGELLCDFRIMAKKDGMMILTDGRSLEDMIACIVGAAGKEKVVMHILLQACYVLMKKDKLAKALAGVFASMESEKSTIKGDDTESSGSVEDFINDL